MFSHANKLVWKLLTFLLCVVHAMWVNTGSLPSAPVAVNNRKPLDLKSYKLLSVLRKLNYECLQNTAGVQATAQTIDTCSHFWRFIIPPWMRIKQTLSPSPALVWWMISWENSRGFCFLKPSTRTPSLHTKTHFQHFHFLRTGPEVRQIRSHVASQIPTMRQKTSAFRIHVWLGQKQGVSRGLYFSAVLVPRGTVWNSFATTWPIVLLTMPEFFVHIFLSCWWWRRSGIAGWWWY